MAQSKKKQHHYYQGFLHFIEERIHSFKMPPEQFLKKFERGIKQYLQKYEDRTIKSIFELDNVSDLEYLRQQMDKSEKYVYFNGKETPKEIGLRYYIDYLKQVNSTVPDDSVVSPAISVDSDEKLPRSARNEELPVSYPEEVTITDAEQKAKLLREGKIKEITVNAFERNAEVRKECIKKQGCVCSVCGFDFEKEYGSELGKGFIHVHHITPMSEIRQEYEVTPDHLHPVCPNCHAMLHRKQDRTLTVEELKEIINGHRNKAL
ncbi:MAG: HNH endonuclease [Bacteroidales bacterium]|jgi:hypothetical protein|nr:HNH endonuclease [Bacteroidales bacterium]